MLTVDRYCLINKVYFSDTPFYLKRKLHESIPSSPDKHSNYTDF